MPKKKAIAKAVDHDYPLTILPTQDEQWGDTDNHIPTDNIDIGLAFGNTLDFYDSSAAADTGNVRAVNDDGYVIGDDGNPIDPDDLDHRSVEELCGSADWLLGEMADGGGTDDDWEVSALSIQELLGRSRDLDQELVVSTIHHYTSSEHRDTERRLRRVNPQKAASAIEEIFNEDGDEDLLPVAYVVRDTIMKALTENNAFAMEWIFGAVPVETTELPTRADTLALFQAREITFWTRVQYQMWINDIRYEMKFLVAPLPRRLQFLISAALENRPLLYVAAMDVCELIWKYPGIEQPELVKRLCKDDSLTEEDIPFILEVLEDDYVISRKTWNEQPHWYFTGINPQRRLKDARTVNPQMRMFNQTRSWSQWW
jgi:hypothetical protein